MQQLYNEESRNALRAAWEKLINNEDWDFSAVRPEIYKSWLYSRSCLVNPFNAKLEVLSASDLNRVINSNLDLIEMVHPYMTNLYSIVKGSGFYLLLCDKEGYILDILGDKDMIEQGKDSTKLIIGANRSERYAGTNAIGTCLSLAKPIQIWGEEHYLEPHKNFCCSAAPIFDAAGHLLGCLNITGMHTASHSHTLGMIIGAVDGINKELKILSAYNELKMVSAQRNSIIETIPSGLILLNDKYRVMQVNKKALQLLGINYQDIIGKDLFSILSLGESDAATQRSTMLSKETYNNEVNITVKEKDLPPTRLNMSVDFVKDELDNVGGVVIRLNETQKIHRLANRIIGYRASYTFDDIMGESPLTQKMIKTAKKASLSDSNVLILGESGTGKELIAQSIHNASHCANGPFVAINCGALPKGLVESELFGYEKGSFTGANKEGNPGKFELADGGTIFLDEIGDMPIDVQVSLLRVLQTREVVRIGAKFPKPVSVRVIAATNRNLLEAVEAKTFREDLYYRLNVFTIHIPSLKQRPEDVIVLAKHFVSAYNMQKGTKFEIAPETFALLTAHDWPGNVRELENIMERALNLTDSHIIGPQDLPANLFSHSPAALPTKQGIVAHIPPNLDREEKQPATPSLQSTEYNAILAALKDSGGNVKKAAEQLGISRRTIYRKLEKYEIPSDLFRD